MYRRLLLGLLSVVVIGCFAPAVHAEIVIPNEWYFRYVFVTSATTAAGDAGSGNPPDYADINYWNGFVSALAAANPELADLKDEDNNPVTWTAIVSTYTVDARDNTGTNPNNGSHESVPIFRLDGAKVADGNSDLWDGSIQRAINVSDTEATGIDSFVWTGSTTAGVEYIDPKTGGSGAVGTFSQTEFGLSSSTGASWIDAQQHCQ